MREPLTEPMERVVASLGRAFAGRRWVVAVPVLPSATRIVRDLLAFGASEVYVLAARQGVGERPATPHTVLGLPPATILEGIRTGEEALRNLPADVQAAVDTFDPERTAQVIGAIFSDGRPVAGRAFFGARPEVWRRLEDKLEIDALWDAVGVARAPSLTAPVELERLLEAAQRVDQGFGTVWAGDTSQGFHGGGTLTFWVRTPDQAEEVAARLATYCERARVMPFLEGVPCSVHGLVFDRGVVVGRPAEMVVLRRPPHFVYARAGTTWDPPASGRALMRAIRTPRGRALGGYAWVSRRFHLGWGAHRGGISAHRVEPAGGCRVGTDGAGHAVGLVAGRDGGGRRP